MKANQAEQTARHTSGPWRVSITKMGARLVTSESGEFIIARAALPADARLIAAAPELLEACQEIIAGMVDGPNSTQKNVTAYAIRKVRAAITKATSQEF